MAEDWYTVRREDLDEHGGLGLLLKCYDNSLIKVHVAYKLIFYYGRHCKKCMQITSGYLGNSMRMFHVGFGQTTANRSEFTFIEWNELNLKREFFDWLHKELGFKKPEDWYNVKQQNIYDHGGRGLLDYYNNSPSQALQAVYPEHNWILAKFIHSPAELWKKNHEQRREFFDAFGLKLENKYSQTPKGFWEKPENKKQFFNWLGNQLGYKSMDDWYNVTNEDIQKRGGKGVLGHYNDSPSRALQAVYPEHNWMLWRFLSVPKDLCIQHGQLSESFWTNQKNQRQFFDWLSIQLEYKQMDDWYSVTLESIFTHGSRGCKGLLNHYNNSPSAALQAAYPEHNWLPWNFTHARKGLWDNKKLHRQFFDWVANCYNTVTINGNERKQRLQRSAEFKLFSS